MSLRERLDSARHDAGLSLERLAEEAGVSLSTLHELRRGERKAGPRTDTIEALAKPLGVKPAWLAGWEENDG